MKNLKTVVCAAGILALAAARGIAAPVPISVAADLSFGGDVLYFPTCITCAIDSVVVVDSQNNRLVVFNRAGEVVDVIGSIGSLTGELLYPQEADIDLRGRMLVTDTANLRVQLWQPGAASASSYPLDYNAQRIAWVDSTRWVVDSNSWRSGHILDVYSADGTKLYGIGQALEADHEWISVPAAVNKAVIDVADGRIAVGLQSQAIVMVYTAEGDPLAEFRITNPVIEKMRQWWWGSCRDRRKANLRLRESVNDPLTLVDDVVVLANEKDANCMYYISQLELVGDEVWIMLDGDIYAYDFHGDLQSVYDLRAEDGTEVSLHYFSRDEHGDVWGLDTMHTHKCYRFRLGG